MTARGRVDRLWPNSTIVCLASGPSLTLDDCEFVRGKARVIAVNTSYERAPWADVLYACDASWWKRNPSAARFGGLKYALEPAAPKGVQVLGHTGAEGLELDPTAVRHGNNSGYQAINVAVHLGASRIVLLGYDLMTGPNGEVHWHQSRNGSDAARNLAKWRLRFPTLVEPLKKAGVAIVNCSRRTALDCFPKANLRDVLTESREAAA